MANWTQQNSRITSDGIKLLARARAGEGQMYITRVLSRDFVQTSLAVMAMKMSDITPESIKQEGIIANSYATNGTSIITARFSNVQNRDRNYTYEIKQIIVIAKLMNEGVEVVGETKVKIAIEEDEEPWDEIEDELSEKDIKEIDEVKDDFIK